MATIAAAKVGTRNDTMSRVAFTAGLRARDLGLDHRATVDALMEVARLAGWEEEIKTRDTAERQFAEGLAMAEKEAGGIATQVAAGVQITVAAGSRSIIRATETALVQYGIIARRDLFKNAIVLSNAPGGHLEVTHEGPLTDNACHWVAKFLRDRCSASITANTRAQRALDKN